jgi:glutathione S-transferase
MASLRVFTFSPGWGLPSIGPFAFKLLAWLELARIPYEQVIEDNPRKGPKGKNPWIKFDGEMIGDTELIIELLSKRYGVDLDSGLTNEQKAHDADVTRCLLLTQMYGPAVHRKRLSERGWSCANVSGLRVEPLLRAMMDIRALPISLPGRP